MGMARVGNPKDFWNTLKSISATEIAVEANLPLRIAIVGAKEDRDAVVQTLYSNKSTGKALLTELREVQTAPPAQIGEFDGFSAEAAFPQTPDAFHLILDLGAERLQAPDGALIYTLSDMGGLVPTLERLLEDKPEWQMALARNFPLLRKSVATRLINQTSVVNAEFALLTGITSAFPPTSVLLPVNALSDIVVLTKNQAMLALRLAAIYDLPVDYIKRSKELAPILGNAFGWRAVAREIVGMIPFGGFVVKAMIAYAGTATIGHAAQSYYETGESLNREQLKALYRNAYAASRETVHKIAERVKRGKHKGKGSEAPKANTLLKDKDVIEAELLPLHKETTPRENEKE